MIEDNKAVVRRYIEEPWNKGLLTAVEELIADDHVTHGGVALERGPENVKQRISAMRTAFPDMAWAVEDMVAEGDRVACRFTVSGTHQGKFLGVASTGKRVTWSATATFRVSNGKIAEDWVNWNQYGLMQQIGAIPT